MLNFGCDREKAHPFAEPHLLTYFASKSVVASWLYMRGRNSRDG